MGTKKIWFVLTVLLAASVLLVLYLYKPTQSSFYPRCPFHWLTGYQCPGCGTLRGLHALTHGHVAEAFRLNAAMVVALPFIVIGLLYEFDMIHFQSRLSRFYRYVITPWSVGISILLWWIGRNLAGW